MTITGADYRLAGTSEDNHLGPFIRLRDLVVCFNSMQNLLSCVMWHRMSFNPGTVGPLCCAQNVLIFILYWFLSVKFRKALGRPGCFLVEMLRACCLFELLHQMHPVLDASDVSCCHDGFAMVAAKFLAFGYFFSWHCRRAQNTSHQAPFPKM